MSVAIDVGFMVIAIVGLAYAAERFVHFATLASERAALSPVFTSVVIVGFGTGVPELFTGALASLAHHPAVGVSSAFGSTALNATLVAGIAAVAAAPRIPSRTLRKEGVAMLVAAVYLVIVTVLQAPWWAGFVGLLVFAAGLVYTLARPRSEDFPTAVEAEAVVGGTSTLSLSRLVIYSIAGLGGTLACAELFLVGALRLADSFGLSQGVTGGILVSIGTSLPEIATSIQAARKGMAGMVAGNVIGSSFFNLAGVGSVALLLGGNGSIGGLGIPAVAAALLVGLMWILMRTGLQLRRLEGVVLLICYLVYVVVLAGSKG